MAKTKAQQDKISVEYLPFSHAEGDDDLVEINIVYKYKHNNKARTHTSQYLLNELDKLQISFLEPTDNTMRIATYQGKPQRGEEAVIKLDQAKWMVRKVKEIHRLRKALDIAVAEIHELTVYLTTCKRCIAHTVCSEDNFSNCVDEKIKQAIMERVEKDSS